jgi:O-antigen/teichoic acid export membrane protein
VTINPDPETSPDAAADSGSLHHRAAHNTLALIGGRVAGMALTGVSSVLLTRCLGASDYGQYAAIQAYLLLFSWAATFGLDAILPRELASRPERAATVIRGASLISACFSALTITVSLAASTRLSYAGLFVPLALAAAEILGLAPLRVPSAAYQADLRQWFSVAAFMARQITWVALLAILWVMGAGLTVVMAARLLAALVEVSITLFGLRSKFRGTGPREAARERVTRELLRAAVPVALTGLAACVYHRADQVLLHRFVDPKFVGHYAAATNVIELCNILPTAVMSSLFPLLVRTQAGQTRDFDRYVSEAARYLLVCAFGVCVLFSLAGAQILAVFGPSFREAGPIAAVLVWSEIASFVTVIMTNVVLAKGLQRFLPLATVVGAALNLGLNLLLIPRLGGLGAAWATVASYSAVAVILAFAPPQTRLLALRMVRTGAPVAGLAVLAVLAGRLVPAAVGVRLAIAVAIYAGGLLVTRTLVISDLRALVGLLARARR